MEDGEAPTASNGNQNLRLASFVGTWWRILQDAWARTLGTDIFISYAHSDGAQIAEPLEKYFQAHGFLVFRDRSSLDGTSELTPEIRRAVRRCRLFVVIVTHSANASRWVAKEVRVRRSQRRRWKWSQRAPMYPVFCDGITPSQLSFGLRRLKDVRGYEQPPGATRFELDCALAIKEVFSGWRQRVWLQISLTIVVLILTLLPMGLVLQRIHTVRAAAQAVRAAQDLEINRYFTSVGTSDDPNLFPDAEETLWDLSILKPSDRRVRETLLSKWFADDSDVEKAFAHDGMGLRAACGLNPVLYTNVSSRTRILAQSILPDFQKLGPEDSHIELRMAKLLGNLTHYSRADDARFIISDSAKVLIKRLQAKPSGRGMLENNPQGKALMKFVTGTNCQDGTQVASDAVGILLHKMTDLPIQVQTDANHAEYTATQWEALSKLVVRADPVDSPELARKMLKLLRATIGSLPVDWQASMLEAGIRVAPLLNSQNAADALNDFSGDGSGVDLSDSIINADLYELQSILVERMGPPDGAKPAAEIASALLHSIEIKDPGVLSEYESTLADSLIKLMSQVSPNNRKLLTGQMLTIFQRKVKALATIDPRLSSGGLSDLSVVILKLVPPSERRSIAPDITEAILNAAKLIKLAPPSKEFDYFNLIATRGRIIADLSALLPLEDGIPLAIEAEEVVLNALNSVSSNNSIALGVIHTAARLSIVLASSDTTSELRMYLMYRLTTRWVQENFRSREFAPEDRVEYTNLCESLDSLSLIEVLRWPFCTGEAEAIVLQVFDERTTRKSDGHLLSFIDLVMSSQIPSLSQNDLVGLPKRPSSEKALSIIRSLKLINKHNSH